MSYCRMSVYDPKSFPGRCKYVLCTTMTNPSMIVTNNQLSHVMSLGNPNGCLASTFTGECCNRPPMRGRPRTKIGLNLLSLDGWHLEMRRNSWAYFSPHETLLVGQTLQCPKRPHLSLSQWGSYMKSEDAKFFWRLPHNVLLETNHPSGYFEQSLPCRIMLYEGRNTVINVWSDHIKFYRFNLRIIIINRWQVNRSCRPMFLCLPQKFWSPEPNATIFVWHCTSWSKICGVFSGFDVSPLRCLWTNSLEVPLTTRRKQTAP